MEQEAQQAPSVLQQQLQTSQLLPDICRAINAKSIYMVMTIARGSSDHAATFAKYLFETQLGLVTSSAAPSVQTIYQQPLQVKHALVIAISQSGQSQDICETLATAKQNGALTLALVNHTDSPLANIADFCLPLCAEHEQAVAATKSYLASLTRLTQLVALLRQDKLLINALQQLPEYLEKAANIDWPEFIETYKNANDTLICGRGFSYPIAQESALKFKETSAIHAESFSSAEVLHGPFALVRAHYPLLIYAQADQSLEASLNLARKISSLEGKVLWAAASDIQAPALDCLSLALPKQLHPICDPIVAIQAFYPNMARLALLRGYNPDQPEHLQKVTDTR